MTNHPIFAAILAIAIPMIASGEYILQVALTDGETPMVRTDGTVVSTVSEWSEDKYGIGVRVGVDGLGPVAWCVPVADPDYSDSVLSSGDGFWMNRAVQFSMPDSASVEDTVVMELGYYDEDWSFHGSAYATGTFADLMPHMYERGTILPPVTDWEPPVFTVYGSVPEPAATGLFLLGAAILFMGRQTW